MRPIRGMSLRFIREHAGIAMSLMPINWLRVRTAGDFVQQALLRHWVGRIELLVSRVQFFRTLWATLSSLKRMEHLRITGRRGR